MINSKNVYSFNFSDAIVVLIAFVIIIVIPACIISVCIHENEMKNDALENISSNIEEFKEHYHSMYGLTPITHLCNDRFPRCDVSFRESDGDIVVYRATCNVDECYGELP